mmetsp:Transcript_57873/g.179848  ORF Transcript_57873/g.179848 Transcript_57873/m.179848 type:complete len:348 (-) Transcript_57873:100-1143(-)
MAASLRPRAALLAALLALTAQALRRDGLLAQAGGPVADRGAEPLSLASADSLELGEGEEREAAVDAAWGPSCTKILTRHYEKFYESFADRFAKLFASQERATYSIVAEVRELRLLKNSLLHLADVRSRTKADMMVTVIALDEDTNEACIGYQNHPHLRRRLDCVNLAGWIDDDFLGLQRENKYQSGVYKFMVATKPLLFYNAVKASRFGVLALDADVIVRDDLLGYAMKAARGRTTIVTSDDSAFHKHSDNKTNTGIVYAAPSALGIVRQWSERMVPACGCSGDMPVFNSLRSHDPRIFKDIKLIPDEMVAGRGREAVYAAHYNNCGETLADKIVIMKQNGEWWLDH